MAFSLRRSISYNLLFKYINLALSVASGILLVPFYLKHLAIHEYGAWLAVGSFATWFAAMDPGIANLLIQKVSRSLGNNNRLDLAHYVQAGVSISLLVAVFVFLIGYCFSAELVFWLEIHQVETALLITAFQLSIGSTAIMILAYALIGVIQGLHNSLMAGLLVIGGGVTRIVAVVAFLLCGHGFLSLALAEISAALLMLLLSALVVAATLPRHRGRLGLGSECVREFIALFAYSFGARLGKIITGGIDNVLIARLIGAEQVAVYSLTATVPRQAENFVNQPIAAFRPTLAYLSASSPKDVLGEHIERMLIWIVWISGWVLAGLLSLNSDFVRLWVGGSAFAGAEVAVALAFLCVLRVWTNSTGAIGFSLGDIRRNSIAEWAYSALVIPSLIVGALNWGLLGVALAHIAAQSVTMAWYFPWSIWRRLEWHRERAIAILRESMWAAVAVAVAWLGCPTVGSWPQFLYAGFTVTVTYVFTLVLGSTALRCEVRRCWQSSSKTR